MAESEQSHGPLLRGYKYGGSGVRAFMEFDGGVVLVADWQPEDCRGTGKKTKLLKGWLE